VEIALEFENGRLARKRAGEPHCQQGRLGTGRGEAHQIGRWDQLGDLFGPLDFGLVPSTEMGALLFGGAHSRHDLGMVMPQDQRSMSHGIIDQPVAIDIPFVGAGGVIDIQRKWFEKTAVMRDPACQ